MAFLTPEQTGGPEIFALRWPNRYLAIEKPRLGGHIKVFDIKQLAQRLGQDAGETWQEHEEVILLACTGGKLFEHLNSGGE
ncbi:MAG: hypothetical protein KAJ19_21210 [Gammaproteobacteria bacterium]|nr:hypothetical protein [Gammaproteobacteria bacterium]